MSLKYVNLIVNKEVNKDYQNHAKKINKKLEGAPIDQRQYNESFNKDKNVVDLKSIKVMNFKK